jgi:hypothetical protein
VLETAARSDQWDPEEACGVDHFLGCHAVAVRASWPDDDPIAQFADLVGPGHLDDNLCVAQSDRMPERVDGEPMRWIVRRQVE